MQRLEMGDKVKRLSQYFLQSMKELEDILDSNNLMFSLDHIDAKIEQYNNKAYLSCTTFFESDCCKRCLLVKLRSLKLDHYAIDIYDIDSDDSGLEM